MEESNLPCLNCHKPIEAGKAKIFDKVFVCSTCYEMAHRTYDRINWELKQLQTMAKEAIRVALVKGELHFSPAPFNEIPKEQLLRGLMQVAADKAKPDGQEGT